MWLTWVKATKFGKLPSEVLDPRGAWDDLTRLCVDNAVTNFGITIENALHEQVKVGSGSRTRHVPKYKLSELLEDSFQFPREDDTAVFRTIEGYTEVRE
jgi:hypothetical protein